MGRKSGDGDAGEDEVLGVGLYEIGTKLTAWNGSLSLAVARLERQVAEGFKLLTSAQVAAPPQPPHQAQPMLSPTHEPQPAAQPHLRPADSARAVEALATVAAKLARLLRETPGAPVGGLSMIYQETLETLAAIGLHPIPTTGSAYDAALHEAVERSPVAPEFEGQIVGVVRDGYFDPSTNRPVLKALVVVGVCE